MKCKTTTQRNLRVEPTIIFMEKILFSLKLFSGHFYGQSFIKTVRGPYLKVYGSPKIVSEYDQEIPQSQTADKPMAPRGRATQQSRDTRKTN